MKKLTSILAIFSVIILLLSCSQQGPKEIANGKDQCDHCRMTITEVKYAAQLITKKGRTYKFDDIVCLKDFQNAQPDLAKEAKTYVVDFESGKFIEYEKATFITGGSIKSPMNGNTQAYLNQAAAQKAAEKLGAKIVN